MLPAYLFVFVCVCVCVCVFVCVNYMGGSGEKSSNKANKDMEKKFFQL